jgi:hypothetical protein
MTDSWGGRRLWPACGGTRAAADGIQDEGLGYDAEGHLVNVYGGPPTESVVRFPMGVCPVCGAVQATDRRGKMRRHRDRREEARP